MTINILFLMTRTNLANYSIIRHTRHGGKNIKRKSPISESEYFHGEFLQVFLFCIVYTRFHLDHYYCLLRAKSSASQTWDVSISIIYIQTRSCWSATQEINKNKCLVQTRRHVLCSNDGQRQDIKLTALIHSTLVILNIPDNISIHLTQILTSR